MLRYTGGERASVRNEKAASRKVTAETPDEARAAVKFYADRHYDGVKIYNSVRPELVPVIRTQATPIVS